MGAKQLVPPRVEIDVEDIVNYQFHGPLQENNSTNGLCFRGIYLPEEVVTVILSHINPGDILKATLVCKKWCNIIKSTVFWCRIYERCYGKQPKKLPWYVFYCYFATKLLDHNLLKNGNGEQGYKHWKTIKNGGDGFRIEKVPCGADPLPEGVPEFNGKKSCFATSYHACIKAQEINLTDNKLLLYIVNKFKPTIYMSEWVAGRFDCGCIYYLSGQLLYKGETKCERISEEFRVEQWQGKSWSKVRDFSLR